MKRFIGSTVAAAALIVGLGACHSTTPGPVCKENKPYSYITLTGATENSANTYASCDGVTSTHHYFWHIRYSDHARTYYKVVPR